ncbi:MAG: hypothetical protein Q8P59_01395, partial [Dehalococcoidia bacterium]|nr:hypothetical protein [Dehalococcoidia bacterium]
TKKYDSLISRVNGLREPLSENESAMVFWLASILKLVPNVPFEVFQQMPPHLMPYVTFQEIYQVMARHASFPTGVPVEEGYIDEDGNRVPLGSPGSSGLWSGKVGKRELRADAFLELLKGYDVSPHTRPHRSEPLSEPFTLTERDPHFRADPGDEIPLQKVEYTLLLWDHYYILHLARQRDKTLGQQPLPFPGGVE